MAEYDITTDTGLSLTLESDGELTQEDVESFLKNRQKEALIRLAAGPGFKDQQAASTYAPYAPMGGLVQPVREDAKGYYSKYIPAALNIPEDKLIILNPYPSSTGREWTSCRIKAAEQLICARYTAMIM